MAQRSATDLLAQMMQAEDPISVAMEHIDSLHEQFFAITSTYISMAKKENNAEMVTRLEAVLKAAMDAKQKTLRPEIQLLNRLLALKNSEAMQQEVANHVEVLSMNDGYFVHLLDRMTSDVSASRNNPQRDELLAQLAAIRELLGQLGAGKP